MTPFGARLRELRAERGMTQKEMADRIGVSAAYLSALEHGHRGVPSWPLLQRIIACLNIIWDDADELQRLAMRSAPKVTIDTSGMDPAATELANLLGQSIGRLSKEDLEHLGRRLRALLDRPGKVPRR
ncbi:helix-turn-helix domain-containing protein [Oricola thermophila]|uniref:Helix-turn-helix transcriptional regulator n=1 Tax=Oricola thermophila TaxID=2742145 RepID=A0A6N1VH90_9HYPH|nr:helix-turn-helix domain-containing protein [Oricola thermophila]QKV19823.1 helix-turn-helix transcriptional regulator [Oricola thermophila]